MGFSAHDNPHSSPIIATETKEKSLVAQRYQAWSEYFEREGIEAISYLMITLRRTDGSSRWIQIDDPPCQIVGPCGDELLQFFECRTAFGDARRAEELLDRRLRLTRGIRLEQEFVMTADGLKLDHVRVRKTGGLQYPLALHENVAHLLVGCDGRHTLRQLVQELAESLDAAGEQLTPLILPVVCSLLERGVLVLLES